MSKFSSGITVALGALALTVAALGQARADDISGAGATFPYPIYAKWAEAYKQQTGIGLNYQSIGSGGGIKQIEAGTVTFGASDKPLEPADLKQNGLVQWPMIIGGVVPVVNIPGIKPGDLMLDGPTIAAIYLGEISRWNDAGDPEAQSEAEPAQARHRTGVPLGRFRHQFPVHQLLVEGQPELSRRRSAPIPRCSGRWASAPRATRASRIRSTQTSGAIGYVEYAYVKQTNMTYAKLRNHDGKFVAPEAKAFQAAAANADWAKADGYYLILTDQPGADSWPITGASFILMHADSKDANTVAALKFFDWAYKGGQKMAEELDYVPLPGQGREAGRGHLAGVAQG